MLKIIIHCPINCESFCYQEVKKSIPDLFKVEYELQISECGILILTLYAPNKKEFSQCVEILSKCATVEILRLEVVSYELPYHVQDPKRGKYEKTKFLNESIEKALYNLFQITYLDSLEVIANNYYWKDFSQQEIQGIFKRIANERFPSIKIEFKKANNVLHISINKYHLKITMELPAQKLFPLLKVHSTPVFPSIGHVMVQLALQQVPTASHFMDAMCGAGNLAFMAEKILNSRNKASLKIDGFDFDPKWIQEASANAQILGMVNIQFFKWDLLLDDMSCFPMSDIDIILSHPPYGHFVKYTPEILNQLYNALLQLFMIHGSKKGCLVINSPRDDILIPIIEKSRVQLVKLLDIPRKESTIKIWVLKK